MGTALSGLTGGPALYLLCLALYSAPSTAMPGLRWLQTLFQCKLCWAAGVTDQHARVMIAICMVQGVAAALLQG